MKKRKVYGDVNRTAQCGELGGIVYGVFTRGGERHIAKYIPYCQPPDMTLCGIWAGVSTRLVDDVCKECLALAKKDLNKIKYT